MSARRAETDTVGARADTLDDTFHRGLRLASVLALGVAAVVALTFVFVGRINADEGWYLYAGRLVWRGELPYADFAFTQTPLMPYVYGLVQSIEPSLVLGRMVSVVLAIGGIALCIRSARRLAGDAAALAVAVLCAAFVVGLYNLTISKTYALVLLAFAATLAALTSPGALRRTLPVAMVAACVATFARTSSAPLAVIVLAYCLWRAPDAATRRNVVAIALGGFAVGAFFVVNDPGNAKYGLLSFHQLLWYDAPFGTRLDTIVTDRIPTWIGDYPAYFGLAVAALAVGTGTAPGRSFLRRRPETLAVALGIAGYLVLQLPAGQFAPVEYLTPMVPVFLAVAVPMIVVGFSGPGRRLARRHFTTVSAVVLVVVAASTVIHPAPWEYIVRPEGAGGLTHQREVARTVRDHTSPGDQVLAMWAQPIVLESGRDFVPGVTLGPFSYADLSRARAEELHFVNAKMLREIIASEQAAAVVLTDIDRLVLGFRGTLTQRRSDRRFVLEALDRHYRKVAQTTTWGIDGPVALEVYVPRDAVSP